MKSLKQLQESIEFEDELIDFRRPGIAFHNEIEKYQCRRIFAFCYLMAFVVAILLVTSVALAILIYFQAQ